MDGIIKQAYDAFSELISTGMYIMPPDNNFLFYEQYDFSQLSKHRDTTTGLIGQFQSEVPLRSGFDCANGLEYTIDFGDSAHKTGVLAFCNSEQDQQYLPQFENEEGIMVRHPNQPPWNNWKNCTRDQLLAYSAGCWRAKKYDIVRRLLEEHNKRANIVGLPLCQNSEEDCPGTTKPEGNTDILIPSEVMFLRICSGDFDAYKDPVGQLALQIAIEVTSKDVTLEKNQLLLQAIVCGRLDLYVYVHDNFRENIRHYWGGWRNQPQIGEALIKVVEQELKRYSGQLPPRTLGLPFETIKSIFNLDFEELRKRPLEELAEYASKIILAFGSDIQKIAKEIEIYISNALKNPLSILNIPFMPFNPIAKLIDNLFRGTDLTEVYNRLNEIQKGIVNLTNLVKELKDDIHAIPEKVAAYDATVSLTATAKEFNIYYDSFCRILDKKGHDAAIETHKSDFEKLSDYFLKDVVKFAEVNKTYPFIPLVVNTMNMHLSCLALAGKHPSILISILSKVYKPWFEGILNDESEKSLRKILENLKRGQMANKLSFHSLYTLKFIITKFEQTKLPDLGGGPGGGFPIDGGYRTEIKGNIKKIDYSLNKLLDNSRINELQPLLDRSIMVEGEFPELGIEQVVEEREFSQLKEVAFTPWQDPVDFEIRLQTYEAKQSLRPIDIFLLCSKQKNVESSAYPQQNEQSFHSLKNEIITVGESIIRHATFFYTCLTTIEKIDEIINTSNELLDN